MLLFLFAFFVLFFNLWGRTLENKDYIRYPEIARAIVECGDWTVMHLNGRIYDHKLPLHFWSTAVAYKLFGVNAFAVRIPAALYALAGVLALYWFCARFFHNKRVAIMAALALLSSYGYLWWARRTRVDMTFSTCFSIGLLCFYAGWRSPSRWKKIAWYFTFWTCLVGAFLIKAHVAFMALLPVIVFSIVAVARYKNLGRFSAGWFLLSVIAFLLPLGVWLFFLSRHPEFQHYWDTFSWKALTSKLNEISRSSEGPLYYIPQLLVKPAPCVLFFFLGLWKMKGHRSESGERAALVFSLLWFILSFVVLQFTSVKNGRYLLPLYMPCAVVGGWAIVFFEEHPTRLYDSIVRWADRVLFSGALLFSVSPMVWACYHGASLLRAFFYTAVLVPILLLFRRLWRSRPAGIFLSFILVVLVIDLCDTARNECVSENLQVIRALGERSLDVEDVIFFRCPRREQEVLAFYFNRLLQRERSYGTLAETLKKGAIRGVVTQAKNADETAETLSKNRGFAGFTRVDLKRHLTLFYKGRQTDGQK